MTRKQFLVLAVTAAGGALAAACGGSNSSESASQQSAGNCLANGTTSTIVANHGHVLVISKEDIMAGGQKTYDIRGSADHTHQVTLTAADMLALQQNMRAQESSSIQLSHSHTVVISCA